MGLQRVGWHTVPVLAAETFGADSYYRSLAAGRLVTLDKIESIAKSLGARTVAQGAFNWSTRHSILPRRVDDAAALDACIAFANEERILVEPACGAALAVAYATPDPLPQRPNAALLVIVCGGAHVDLEMLTRPTIHGGGD